MCLWKLIPLHVEALAHYSLHYKKFGYLPYTYTFHLFFPTATIFWRFYIWAMVLIKIFLEKSLQFGVYCVRALAALIYQSQCSLLFWLVIDNTLPHGYISDTYVLLFHDYAVLITAVFDTWLLAFMTLMHNWIKSSLFSSYKI